MARLVRPHIAVCSRVPPNHGFTLIELLIVIFIIALLVILVFINLNPLYALQHARNSRRDQAVQTISTAFELYKVDNQGQLPAEVSTQWQMIGTANLGCNIVCGSTVDSFAEYTHQTATDFAAGNFTDTQVAPSQNLVELTSAGQTAGTGSYTSPVFDAGADVVWSEASWQPTRPVARALPNNGLSETIFQAGQANMTANLVLYHFDDTAGGADDSSGNGHEAEEAGNGVTYGSAGQFGSSLEFAGSDDYVVDADAETYLNGLTAITVSAWVKADTTGTDRAFLNGEDPAGDGTDDKLSFRYDVAGYEGGGSNLLKAGLTINGTERNIESSSNVQTTGWQHLVLTWQTGDTMRLYINGQENALTSPEPIISGQLTNIQGLWLGGGPKADWDGQLDEVAIWGRQLSAAEVEDLYLRGALRLHHQVRTCDDPACSGEVFVGPGGNPAASFSEATAVDNQFLIADMSVVPTNRYFQYQTTYETDLDSVSPQLTQVNVTGGSNSSGAGVVLPAVCYDAYPALEPYLKQVPVDPLSGSQAQTFYAVRKNAENITTVRACGAEADQEISVSR